MAIDRGGQGPAFDKQAPLEPILDSEVRETLAEISGVRHLGQRRDHPSFHPFPARMPLSVAQFLVERLTLPGAVVADPMCGSGTTLVVAKKIGRAGIGFDLDPLAVIMSRATTLTIDPSALCASAERVAATASEFLERSDHRLTGAMLHLPEEDQMFLDYWFPPRSQAELAALASAIRLEQRRSLLDVLWAIFSSLIIAKSAGASYALDLAHSRPHRDLNKRISWPIDAWSWRLRRAIESLVFRTGEGTFGSAEVRVGDARALGMQESTVDLILTSPPYLQAIDYMRVHKFALVWMGHELESLRHTRSVMIGTERGLYSPDSLPEHIESSLIDSISTSARRARIRRYLSDTRQVLSEIHRVLKPGGLAVFVAGPSIVSRSRHDAGPLLAELAGTVGLSVIDVVARRLNDSRRALPPPRRVVGKNDLNKRFRTELFVAMRKV